MNNSGSAMGMTHEEAGRTPYGRLAADAHPAHDAGDACMFCDDSLGMARAGEDPLAFRDHIARSEHCQREYQLWKQVITDEWLGD